MATRKFFSFRFSGVDVEFPHETPYPAQKGIISNSLQAFLNFDNALLESPTGTGKSLALLAGALAYQKHIGTHPIVPPLKRDPYQPHPEEMLLPSPSFVSASQLLEAPYKCNVAVKRHNVPVWYTSRTHGQLKQLVGELRKLPYFPQMTILAARKRICLFDPIRLSRDPDTACAKSKTCPYERHRGVPDDFRPRGRHGKFDLEDLVAFCQARMICPYFLTRDLMRIADLVFCPYSYVMNPKVKGQMMLSILGVVLIVDEAHNVEAQIRETTSFSHRRCDLLLCVGALNRLAESQKDTELAAHLLLVRDIFSGYLRFFHSMTTRMRERGTQEFVARDNLEYLAALGVTRESWAQVRTSLDHVFVAVNGGINRETKAKVKIPMYVSGPLEQLYVVIALSVKKNFRFIDAFRFVVQLGPVEDEDEFLALCMSPGAYFSTIADEVNSVVLASGTLAPVHQLAGELGTQFGVILSAPHVVTSSQLAGFTIGETPSKVKLCSSYAALRDERDRIETGLGRTVLELLPVIPGGVLMFVPSHPFLESLLGAWQREGLLDAMRQLKPFFRERSENDSDLYVEFKEAIEREGGALLAGVFRGRMSEGIDFYDDQARAVIAFGIPYPPVNDLEVRLKREYNDAHDEGPNGREWYDAQAFRSLWQATGRCLRHAGDYGTVVLIDSRFPGHIERFPRWMRASFRLDAQVPDVVEELGSFFREMDERFPTKQVFHAGRPAILACAACGRRVVEVEGIGTFECVTLARREGLRRVLDGERADGCLFLPKPQLSGNVALGEVRFEGDDLAAYAAVACACGQVLGAKMVAGTTDEIALFDGVWMLLAKVTGTQGSVKSRLDSVLVPKASLKLAIEGKGQRILAYIEDE